MQLDPKPKSDEEEEAAKKFGDGITGWLIMACKTQLEPQNTNGVTDMFLPSYYDPEGDAQACMKDWGVVSQPGFTLDYFGGRNPNVDFKDVTNIIFSNGSLDPWHAGGVLAPFNDVKKSKVAIIWIEGGAHHYDLRGTNAGDLDSVRTARQIESDHINDYIDQYNQIPTSRAGKAKAKAAEIIQE